MMVILWIIIVILCLLTATGSALIALRLQNHAIDNTRREREAWQQAQEGRQRIWEVRQGKHILDAEKKLADQLKDARREWREWSMQAEERQQEWQGHADIEKELARLPHIEHLELPHVSGRPRNKQWHAPALYQTDLRGRDLSYRYMERADLREAQLADANLYMTDLTGASLAGANLERACLIGANLSGTDLRGANLSGVNLLVADLHNAVLHGTTLTGARNLTSDQLKTAIYDSTTIIDSSVDITLPRIPGVQTTPPTLLNTNAADTRQENETTKEMPSTDVAKVSTPDEPAEKAPSILVAETTDSTVLASNTFIDSNIAVSAAAAPATQEKRAEDGKRAGKQKENDEETVSENETSLSQNVEDAAEKKVRSNKIIQLQARTPKATGFPSSQNQSKVRKPAKKHKNSRSASFGDVPATSKDQHAQAN